MNKYFLWYCLLTIGSAALQAQPVIKGVITDAATGQPVANATIRLANHRAAITATAPNGSFRIVCPAFPDSLIVTHIGYEPYFVTVTAPVSLQLRLQPVNTELETVTINTGYQKLKPNEVNGSYVVIDNKTLNEQTGTNILQRLNGVTNGLIFNSGKVGASGEDNPISIRGLSTINGPLAPLIIVDNFPYEGEIENINPEDVQNVTVLKDAAAASIWGARAGNGVIVITTKKAKYNDRLRVNLNTSLLFTKPADLFYQSQMPVADYLKTEAYLFNKGYFDETINDTYSFPALSPVVEMLLKHRDGLVSTADSTAFMEQLSTIDTRQQYSRYFQQTGITQQYALSVSGGSGIYAWLMSGSYNRVISTNAASADKKNIHLNNQLHPIKNLTITVDAYYTNSQSKTGKPDFGTVSEINGRYIPYLSYTDENGQPVSIDQYRKAYTDTAGGGRLLSWDYLPLEDYKHRYTASERQELLARIGIDYHFSGSLSASVQYQYQKQWSNSTTFSDIESFYTRDLINRFTVLPADISQPITYPIPLGSIINKFTSPLVSKNLRGQLNFSHTWHQHQVSAILGSELRDAVTGPSDGFTVYGYQEDPLSYVAVDFTRAYPTIITGSYQYLPGGAGIGPKEFTRFASFYANGSYVYKRKYSLNGSLRKDASNLFGVSTNDKWNPLWSSGIGWNLSNEDFYHSTILPYLKLRVTYGYSGNVDARRTPLPISAASTNSITGFPTQRISGLNNPSLRWEKSRQVNLGLDFETKGKIISGTLEYYLKKGTDLYGETPYDYTAWGRDQYIIANVANMQGRGLDVTINTVNLNRALKWRTSIIYNYNSSKTTAYFSDDSNDFFDINDGSKIFPVVGKPLYSITAYKWGGLNASGDPQGYLEGQLSTDYSSIYQSANTEGLASGSIEFIGPATPVHFGSVINYLEWKGFSFSANLMFKAGYYFLKSSFTSLELITGGTGHGDYTLRWQQPGDELKTNVPAFVYTDYTQFQQRDNFYINAAPNVVKADHIRLHYINLAYDFELKTNGSTPIKLRVYGNAANLGIIWRANRYGLDPDAAAGYPAAKQYTLGIRADF
ncbi:MAG: SusC/RagA family TonB-linked outer membrane protein [Niabella sp.]